MDAICSLRVKSNFRKIDCEGRCWTEHDLDATCFEWAGEMCRCRQGVDQWVTYRSHYLSPTLAGSDNAYASG